MDNLFTQEVSQVGQNYANKLTLNRYQHSNSSDDSDDSDLIGIEDLPQFRHDYFPPADADSFQDYNKTDKVCDS